MPQRLVKRKRKKHKCIYCGVLIPLYEIGKLKQENEELKEKNETFKRCGFKGAMFRRIEIQHKQINKLKQEIEEWIHELAYYTKEEVATPKGVKAFFDENVGKSPNPRK